jgi:hypothetical protein
VGTDAGQNYATNVQIAVQVSDSVDPNAGYSCVPDSSFNFPIGVTQVTCTAADASQNKAQCSTSVAVNAKVLVDVRPGKCPNLVKFESDCPVPIAILGSANFDVSKIVLSSLRLDGIPAEAEGVVIKDFTSPFKSNSWWSKRFAEFRCARKDKDGFNDLRVYFNQTAIADSHRINKFFAIDYVTLTGQMQDGQRFEGKDIVVVTSFRRKPKKSWKRSECKPGNDREDDRDDDDDQDCEYVRYRQDRKEWSDWF